MATEYGYRKGNGIERFSFNSDFLTEEENRLTRDDAERIVKANPGYTLIAREVSEPRIVSIRA